MTTATSIYKNLPINDLQFRVLDLEPASSFDDRLVCRMRLLDIQHVQTWNFSALSYTWGSSSRDSSVFINGESLQIHSNLASFLRHFRDSTATKSLWADAICINQDDIQERNSQTPLMNILYASAPRLIIWLGPSYEDSDLAMETLDYLGQDHTYAKMPNLSQEKLESIRLLLTRPWWSRAWIIQEVVFGGLGIKFQRMNVHCGNQQIPWLNMVLAAARMKAHETDMRQRFAFTDRILDLDSLRESAWERMQNPFRPDQGLHLLEKYRRFDASDPRDKIYAIARMFANVRPERRKLPPVDYSSLVEQVYADFILYCIYEGHTGEFLRQCGEAVLNVPSWVPDWSVRKRAHSLPVRSVPYYVDVPWWAEPNIKPGNKPGSVMISFAERGYPRDPDEAAKERQKRIRRLEIDAMGSGVVTDFGQIPPNFTFNQISEHLQEIMETLVKENKLVLVVGDESTMPPNDTTRSDKWYNCLEEGERITEREVKKALVAQLNGWESSYQASGTSALDMKIVPENAVLRLDGVIFDSISTMHEGFVEDVEADWTDATRFMVQVGQCKTMALGEGHKNPYSTESSLQEAFWLTLFVGQIKPGVFSSQSDEETRSLLRYSEWLPEISHDWEMAEPPLTVTTNGTLEADWNGRLASQSFLSGQHEILGDSNGQRGHLTVDSAFDLDASFRAKTWTKEETENLKVQFNEISKLWKQQPFDLYHRPFGLLNVVPDPYWSTRESKDALALQTTQTFGAVPMVSFPALNGDLPENFDESGNLHQWTRDLRERLTPETQARIRQAAKEAVESKPCIVPQGTLPAGMEKHALSRKFFVTEKGYFGLGPRSLERGDRVAVIFGSRVPFVLRQVVRNGKQFWTLIGETYVHGIMQGEAMTELEAGVLEKGSIDII